MAFGLNRAELIGCLGTDATITHLVSGGHVANMSIATDEIFPHVFSDLSRQTYAGTSVCSGDYLAFRIPVGACLRLYTTRLGVFGRTPYDHP